MCGKMVKKMRRRRFVAGECSHVYQRTVDGVVLFHDREDFLMFYMIVSVTAKKRGVRLLMMCLMIDHVHLLLETDTLEQMADFVRDYSSVFAKEYNDSIGRHGKLFVKSYGSAPKNGDKRTRSAIVYIGNNPVEKMLCHKAEEYRWNFLKYIEDKSAFSNKLPVRNYSRSLGRSVKIVDAAAKAGCYLNYVRLYYIFSKLSEREKEILTDHLIMAYYPFDIDRLMEYYNDYEQMLSAMHSTSGSEYDIKEIRHPGSDRIYDDMITYVKGSLGVKYARSLTMLPNAGKLELADALKVHTGASLYEISKFLHMKRKKF